MALTWLFAFRSQESSPSPVTSGYTQLTGSLMIATSPTLANLDSPTAGHPWVAGPEVPPDWTNEPQIVAWASSSLGNTSNVDGETGTPRVGFWRANDGTDTSLLDLLNNEVLPQIGGIYPRVTLAAALSELQSKGGWSSKDTDINPHDVTNG